MATGGDHDRLRVTVLTGEANWASWKVQMWHQLRSRKLWDIVRGEERIATGAEQGEKIAFEERCIEATMRLTFAMSPAVILLVQNLECPVKIWDHLERQYEKRTASSKLSLVQRYFGAKMAEGESAEKHLLGMNELCDRLAAMELPVPEEFQPLTIFGESSGQLHCDRSDVGLTGREVRHDPCDQHRPRRRRKKERKWQPN